MLALRNSPRDARHPTLPRLLRALLLGVAALVAAAPRAVAQRALKVVAVGRLEQQEVQLGQGASPAFGDGLKRVQVVAEAVEEGDEATRPASGGA